MRMNGPMRSYPTFEAAVTEAVRLTELRRTKFDRPENPPYRVRKRAGQWSDPQFGSSRWVFTYGRESWMVFDPNADIPDRRKR